MTDREFIQYVLPRFRFTRYDVEDAHARIAWLFKHGPLSGMLVLAMDFGTTHWNEAAPGSFAEVLFTLEEPPAWALASDRHKLARLGRDVEVDPPSSLGACTMLIVTLKTYDLILNNLQDWIERFVAYLLNPRVVPELWDSSWVSDDLSDIVTRLDRVFA